MHQNLQLVPGIAGTALIGYKLMPKRRRISSSKGSVKPNSNGLVDQTDLALFEKQIQDEVKRQLDAAQLILQTARNGQGDIGGPTIEPWFSA